MILLFALLWVVCGVLAAGFNFAYFQDKYPGLAAEQYREDLVRAICLGLLSGPISLVAMILITEFTKYGWRLRRKK